MDDNFPFAGYGLVAVGVLLTVCKAESGEHAMAVVTYLIMHIVLFFGVLQRNCSAVQAYAKFAMLVFIIHVAAIVIKTCEEVLKLKPLLSFEVLNLVFIRAVEVLFMYALLQLVIKITGDFVEKVNKEQGNDDTSPSKGEIS
ncbi:uncharacterized protein LOC120418011 [Culex pipiens pallens]|uniref:uncharacterized protein LOC120418011 n=1 Tax=Culex pipiens pallens TaxID=42434 RepID=UPI0022AB2508|nr:uncharacterized protein LOC120418011 [Culex pipiens pallens]